jgi:hypothetical protein
MLPWDVELVGRLDRRTITSELLVGNPLGDPQSSGGFGAMITAMLRPDLFGALATHSGDNLYELCYIPMFAKGARALRQHDHDTGARSDDRVALV